MKDGTYMENSHGYPVGHCKECRMVQIKMYLLSGEWYCISCFPKMVEFKTALEKLKVKK